MNSRTRVKLLGLAVAAVLLTLGTGSAPGGGSDGPGTAPLSLIAGPGEDNHVTVGLIGSEYQITDTAGIPYVSPACRRISSTAAACPALLVGSIAVELKDGNDSFEVVGGGIAVPYSVDR